MLPFPLLELPYMRASIFQLRVHPTNQPTQDQSPSSLKTREIQMQQFVVN